MAIVKIVDPAEKATVDLKKLIDPIKTKMTSEELEVYGKSTTKEERRTLAIQYYDKYIDAIIEAEVAKAAAEAKVLSDEELAAQQLKDAEEAKLNETNDSLTIPKNETVQNEEAPALSIEDFMLVEIRDVPGFNGTTQQNVGRIIELAFKYPKGTFRFKNSMRAAAFIATVKSCTKVKGFFNLSVDTKNALIKKVAFDNKTRYTPIGEEKKEDKK